MNFPRKAPEKTSGTRLAAFLLFGLCFALSAVGGFAVTARGDSPSASVSEPAFGTIATPRSGSDAEEEPLRFRYWMAPAGQIDHWPWGP